MTHPHLTLTSQLLRLAKHPLGLKEAALLFAVVDGATVPEIISVTGDHQDNVRGRLGGLMMKGLLMSENRGGEFITYLPTPSGMELIRSAYVQSPSVERGCSEKANLGRGYIKQADTLAAKHGKRYGVYRCPHCGGTHLTTKLEKQDKYPPLLYITKL
jgi:hypothetical protein